MTSSPARALPGRIRLAPGVVARVAGVVRVAKVVGTTLLMGTVLSALSNTAHAQGAEPTVLLPPPQDMAPANNGATGNSGSTWMPTTAPAAVIGTGDDTIEVNVLKTLGADMAGVLNGENGGFQPSVWRGTPRQTVDRLFAVAPVHTTSTAMRALMRRLFLTQSVPPEGNAADGGFVAERLALLAAMGDVKGVEDLLAVTPGRETNEQLIRLETDIQLLHGDMVRACSLAGVEGRAGTSDYWQKLMAFCQGLSGARSEAQLGLSLLREVGVEDDRFYLMMDALLASEVPVINDLSDLSPLHIAMMRVTKARLKPDTEAPLPPTVLSAIAGNPDLDMGTRLAAAERAAGAGVLSIDELRQLYNSAPFGTDVMTNPLSAAESLGGPESRSLLYQVVRNQTVDGAKAEAISLALETALAGDVFAITAQVFADEIKQVPPRSDLVWFAGHAVRALVLAGDPEASTGWLGLLRVSAPLSEEASMTLAQLAPIVRLPGLDDDDTLFTRTTGIDVWRKTRENKPGFRDSAILYYSLLESLGRPVDTSAWDALGYDGQAFAEGTATDSSPADLPDPVLWQRLSAAARSGKTGETVLLALAMLGEEGTTGVNAVTMSHVVEMLALAGLTAEARSLAVEAALEGGL